MTFAQGAATQTITVLVMGDANGKDRISASTLQQVATALGFHPGAFYDDAPVPTGGISGVKAALKAAEALQQIRNPRVLRQVLMLAKVLAEEEAGREGEVDFRQPFNGNDEAR